MTAAAPKFVNQKWLADASGLDRRTVAKILIEHEIARTAHGFNRAEAEFAIRMGHDPSLTAGHASVGRGNVMTAGTSELAKHRASAEEQRAVKLRLENDITIGRYVLQETVAAEAEKIASEARTAFLSLGSRLAHRLVNIADQRHAKQILDKETADIANEFAAKLRAMCPTPDLVHRGEPTQRGQR